jgi:hypothetical protein
MGELSILTIVVSLAVCSILVVALYQYVNQRLSFAEHSQKEQAMILQQYIEESSYDIHYLKQFLVAKQQYQQQYDNHDNNVNITEIHDMHMPGIDTAIYDISISNNNLMAQKKTTPTNFNNRRLIPVSSDSENTTTDSESSESESSESDSESESCDSSDHLKHSNIKIIELSHDLALSRDSDEEDDTDSSETSSDADSESSDSNSESIDTESIDTESSDSDRGCSKSTEAKEDKPIEHVNHTNVEVEDFTHNVTIIEPSNVTYDSNSHIINSTSFDLAIDVNDSNDIKIISDVLDIQLDNIELMTLPQSTITQEQSIAAPLPETQSHTTVQHANTSNYSGKSVSELRQLIKDKYKNEPDKLNALGDIQKMKKPALIQIVEQL